MPLYKGPKDEIDAVLTKMKTDERAEVVKSYRVFVPSNVVEIETTKEIPELSKFRTK